jgi:hypothetical protein
LHSWAAPLVNELQLAYLAENLLVQSRSNP